MKARLAFIAVVLAAFAGTVEPARACSCVQPDPWAILPQADGAFVGSLVGRRETDQGRVVLTFSVERRVKGQMGTNVEVTTANNSASCGIEAPLGRRVGLFLLREGGRWIGHLCWLVEPADLRAAATLPAPNGKGPVAMFMGGRFGPARTLALDAQGRTLAYGMGRGAAALLSPCPGGQRLAEVVPLRSDARSRTTYEVAIRETRSLRVTQRHSVRLPGWRFATGLLCEEPLGSSVVIFANWTGDAPNDAAMHRLTDGRVRAIWQGNAFLSSLQPGMAYLNEGRSAERLVSVDLRTERVTRLAWLPSSPSLEPDANGKRFAGVAYLLLEKSRIVLVDLTMQPPTVRSLALSAPETFGDVLWLSGRRFLFLPHFRPDVARVLDLRLRTRARFSWSGGSGVLVGSTVFGISGANTLVAAELPSGPQRVMRRFAGEPSVIVSARG